MSVFNELFHQEVERKLFDSNAFLSNMKNMSDFLSGRTVHVPNFTQDMSAQVEINGSTYTFDTRQTTETDLTFNIDSYRMLPFTVTNFDELSTNYNKLQVVTENVINKLSDTVAKNILYKLAQGVDATRKLTTSGALGSGNSKNGVTSYNTLSYSDILDLGVKMDEDNIAQDGRFLLLDAVMYKEILADEAIRKAGDFGGGATLPNGVVSTVGGINIMKRGSVAHASSAGVVANYDAVVADLDTRVALAWSSSVIMTAKSGTKVYTDTDNAFKFGSVVSAEIFLGCTNPRTDDKGAYIIYQA